LCGWILLVCGILMLLRALLMWSILLLLVAVGAERIVRVVEVPGAIVRP